MLVSFIDIKPTQKPHTVFLYGFELSKILLGNVSGCSTNTERLTLLALGENWK